MKPNHLVIIAIVALAIVAVVWYSSAGSSGLATANVGETGMGGSVGSLIGSGGALLGGIVDAANSGNTGTVQQPRVEA
jgi:hypothetical protein